jgi:nucleoside-diphosphate-sugar epimerase
MKIFVTGGSGFVGGYLIPFLLEAGHEVFALARSDTSIERVQSLGAIAVKGDITDRESLKGKLDGCDTVVHAAAAFEMWGDEKTFHNINVDATQNLLDAAKAAKIRTFVYIGAASVIAGGVPAHMVDESYRLPEPPDDAYSRTKLLGEQRVIAANSPSFNTIVLRPSLIWGKGHSMTEAMRQAAARGGWVWIGGGKHRLSTIHVQNLCAAVLSALEKGKGGEVYYVTDGAPRTVRQFLSEWLRAEGVELRGPNIPYPLALRFANMMEWVWRTFRLKGTPPVTRAMVYMLGRELSMSDQKARERLGYQTVLTIEEGLRQLR